MYAGSPSGGQQQQQQHGDLGGSVLQHGIRAEYDPLTGETRARVDPRRPYRDPTKPPPRFNNSGVDWSRDITEWLEREEVRQDAAVMQHVQHPGHPQPLQAVGAEDVDHSWVLEYSAKDGKLSHMEEPWSMCVRMWDEALHIRHQVSRDRTKLYITVGATLHELRKEAELIKLRMRMKETKGTVPYSPQLRQYFLETPNGTEFTSAQRQVLVMSRLNRAILLPLEARQAMPPRGALLRRLHDKLVEHQPVTARFLTMVFTVFGAPIAVQAGKIGAMTQIAAKLVTVDPFFVVEPVAQNQQVGGVLIAAASRPPPGAGLGIERAPLWAAR
jgi:hypothetical protein